MFWPIGHTLGETIGWRWTLVLYALLNLAVCLPLHLRYAAARRGTGTAPVPAGGLPAAAPGIEPRGTAESVARDALAGRERDRALLTFAIVLAAYAFVFSCLAAHLIEVIQGLGLAATTAVGLSSMMGVAQVASRSLELIGQRWLAPLTVGVISLGLLPLSLLIMLAAGGDPLVIAGAALLCGAGNGLVTVVRGAVPLALFGHVGYASTLGRIAAPGLASAALAPLIFDRVLHAVGARGGLVLLTVVGLAAFTGMLWLSRQRPARFAALNASAHFRSRACRPLVPQRTVPSAPRSAERAAAPQSASSIQVCWIASRTFSPERFGSSSKPGNSSTQLCRSVNRTVVGSTSGWASTSAIAMSRMSVHFTVSAPRGRS